MPWLTTPSANKQGERLWLDSRAGRMLSRTPMAHANRARRRVVLWWRSAGTPPEWFAATTAFAGDAIHPDGRRADTANVSGQASDVGNSPSSGPGVAWIATDEGFRVSGPWTMMSRVCGGGFGKRW